MKNTAIQILCLFTPLFLKSEIIDQTDFEVPIGSVYQYSGTFLGENGETVMTFLDGSAVKKGAIRGDLTFSSKSGSGDYNASTYTIDGAVIQRRVQNENGTFTITFSPYWRMGPRFIEVGRNYESEASFSYMASGVDVSGSISAEGGIVTSEMVDVPVGRFEALKVQFDLVTTENFDGGWSQTIETDTLWIVRNVGMVKFQLEGIYEDSYGNSRNIVSGYELVYTNRELPSLSPLPSKSWYEGWNYLDQPWSYAGNTKEWYFYFGDPWVLRYSDEFQTRLSSEEIEGWYYMSYPFIYSNQNREWYYMYGPTWIYDYEWSGWFELVL